MKVIKIHHPMADSLQFSEPVVLAMGFFDGIHLGHQQVIKTAVNRAKQLGIKAAVLTYDHHPQVVYKRLDEHDRRYLTLPEQKFQLLEQLGVDQVFLINYSYAFQDQTPAEFIQNYLVRFNAQVVVAGFDHTYGEKQIATMERLPEFSQGRFEIITVPKLQQQAQKVSSTAIKESLDSGNVTSVNKMLGRNFTTIGTVVHGEQVGRTIGYPTINVEHNPLQWLPTIGIYVVRVKIGEVWYQGMASIGKNVTFYNDHPVTVEINLLDFKQNVYGEVVTVEWLKYLRGEEKFASVEELIDQLQVDEQNTRQFFGTNSN
ncbi:riboflavin biosynthesis protein RibF [Lentilactobacillus senioris DSM 24302 = JCM 17472]|uniref:Riboflavin biosynthesis protein n=1 Tax=Lentilactobacillus senioris DSM 24302 = JCM 17472 TaxID=1423802 RepID=A0A0R2CRL0_9LACO|nr:riboflavin biosynthesis protein RibF [Lentilactobacillus senioris]KRM93760.1 riboflavin biosynthesis protein RibF [Lentilactobacillus senioris DSM 24302 = JCM 17472]